jgi:hypothetical protein
VARRRSTRLNDPRDSSANRRTHGVQRVPHRPGRRRSIHGTTALTEIYLPQRPRPLQGRVCAVLCARMTTNRSEGNGFLFSRRGCRTNINLTNPAGRAATDASGVQRNRHCCSVLQVNLLFEQLIDAGSTRIAQCARRPHPLRQTGHQRLTTQIH